MFGQKFIALIISFFLVTLSCVTGFKISAPKLLVQSENFESRFKVNTLQAVAISASETEQKDTIKVKSTFSINLAKKVAEVLLNSPLSNSGKQGVVLQSISGTIIGGANDGKEVVSIFEKEISGDVISVPKSMIFEKPRSLDWNTASMVPYMCLSVIAALESLGFNESTIPQKNIVVIGGNSLCCFSVQLLKAWGAHVLSVTSQDSKKMKGFGADEVINYKMKSFFEESKQKVDLIIDCLGDESNTLATFLQRNLNICYCSIASPIVLDAIDKGLIFGGQELFQRNGALRKKINANKVTVLQQTPQVLTMIRKGVSMFNLTPNSKTPQFDDISLLSDYFEAFSWPKDSSSGLRFGFPSPNTIDEESIISQLNTKPLDLVQSKPRNKVGSVDSKASPQKGVVNVETMAQLGNALQQGGEESNAVVFIGASWCRTCKFLRPHFEKLSAKYEQISFFFVDAGGDNCDIPSSLDIEAVPSFVVFKNLQKISSQPISKRDALDKLVSSIQ